LKLVRRSELQQQKRREGIDRFNGTDPFVQRDSGVSEIEGLTVSKKIQHTIKRGLRFGNQWGVFESTRVTREVEVLAFKGLPRVSMSAVLAHEFFHSWLFCRNLDGCLPQVVEEGLCEFFAFLFLCRAEYHFITILQSQYQQEPHLSHYHRLLQEIRYIKYKMTLNQDPIYGEGFRKVLHCIMFLEWPLFAFLNHIQQNHSRKTVQNIAVLFPGGLYNNYKENIEKEKKKVNGSAFDILSEASKAISLAFIKQAVTIKLCLQPLITDALSMIYALRN